MSERHSDDRDLFREEALDHHSRSQSQGAPLEISPGWARSVHWLILAALLSALLFGFFAKIHDYAAGPAVCVFPGLIEVRATTPGTLASIEVEPGQQVEEGQTVARLYDRDESTALARIESEFELQLANLLRNPTDEVARQALVRLRAERDQARARVEQRLIRTPAAGVVRDLRARSGQDLAGGDVVLTLGGDSDRVQMVAMIPGQFRPQLVRGQEVRVELQGYRRHHIWLQVEEVGEEVLGPAAARGLLGPAIGDAVPIAGPVVRVTMSVDDPSFIVDGQRLSMFDGMLARAEVRVRARSLFASLLPGFDDLLVRNHD